MEKKWSQFMKLLEETVGAREFKRWLRPMRFAGFSEGKILLQIPNDTYLAAIQESFIPDILNCLEKTFGAEWEVNFVLDKLPSKKKTRSIRNLNALYTFDTFVTGPSNQFAYAAALAVAENPAKAYNPLFIYGDTGLGKTHLLHAIGQYIHQHSSLSVMYVSVETFYTELINAVRHGKIPEFRNHYRSTDVLLLDDIQFLANKERSQEEIFHTFNALYDAHKQIVLASDRMPREMEHLEDRLRSRFEWGLLADIQPPDLETKIAILTKKAELANITLPDGVALFIAQLVKHNIRDMEGLLRRVKAYAELTGKAISIEVVKESLKGIIDFEEKILTPHKILRIVSHHYGIKVSEIKSKSNAKRISFPRQVAMWLLKHELRLSYPEIGKLFGNKHHSTIMYGVDKIENLRQNNAEFRRNLEEIISHLY